MFCKHCGKEIKAGSAFCQFCGVVIRRKSIIKRFKFPSGGKKIVLGLVLGASLILGLGYLLTTDEAALNEALASSVVNVICGKGTVNLDEPELQGGSGTIIDPEGVILTNSHVIPSGDDEEVTCLVLLPDPATGEAKEIYHTEVVRYPILSETYDLAILIISGVFTDEDGKQYGEFPKTFPAIGDYSCAGADEPIRLGEKIRIYGYPVASGGFNLTVTEGVVSTLLTEEKLILTSAKVDEGNSGGLAVDENGCMIGIPSSVSEGKYENLGVILSWDLIEEFSEFAQSPKQLELLEGYEATTKEMEAERKARQEAETRAARAAQEAQSAQYQASNERVREIKTSFRSQLTREYNNYNDGTGYYNQAMSYYNSGDNFVAISIFGQARAVFQSGYSNSIAIKNGFTGLPFTYTSAVDNMILAHNFALEATDAMIDAISNSDYPVDVGYNSRNAGYYANLVRNFLLTNTN